MGIVTNLPKDALIPERYIEDEDRLYSVVRTQVDVVLKDGCAVLNADDPMVLEMADLSDGEVILFSENPASEAITSHVQAGKRAVVLKGGEVCLLKGDSTTTVGKPAAAAGSTAALSATGALWFMNLSPSQIAQALQKGNAQ